MKSPNYKKLLERAIKDYWLLEAKKKRLEARIAEIKSRFPLHLGSALAAESSFASEVTEAVDVKSK